MLQGTNSTNNFTVHFDICTNDEEKRLYIEVTTSEKGRSTIKREFTGNEYGAAVEYYKKECAQLEEKYNKLEHFANIAEKEGKRWFCCQTGEMPGLSWEVYQTDALHQPIAIVMTWLTAQAIMKEHEETLREAKKLEAAFKGATV